MLPQFIHLHLHTEYSLVDGSIRIPDLVARAVELQMPAVAVTDQANLFGMIKFYQAACSAGIKPIIGVDASIRNPQSIDQPFRLLLLCKNRAGYQNLSELLSRAYIEGQHLGIPLIERDWLKEKSAGLIAVAHAQESDVVRYMAQGDVDSLGAVIRFWAEYFPDAFYLELTRLGQPQYDRLFEPLVDCALRYSLPVVATNDVRFLTAEDFDAHEVRVCINEGRTLADPRRSHRYTPQQYLRSPAEMAELFADLPQALANSVAIAARCSLVLELGQNYLPKFPVPTEKTEADYLAALAEQGLEERLQTLFGTQPPVYAERRPEYCARLKFELAMIAQMGFPGYFLIVADFIRWAKTQGIPVGPGRGSGAGSLVAYALKITDLDPIRYELLFERFLNPERVSMPDFDIDFCMDRRDEVIEYVALRYGREKVAQIITYGSMAAKAVVRDVGRVLGLSYGFVDRIAKLIPFEVGITLEKAFEQVEELRELYKQDDEVQALIDRARSLEGLVRNAGTHAGGVVIAPSRITDFSPLYCEQGSTHWLTQFDKNDIESMGLVKFDFLGLRTLTIIDWAVKSINIKCRELGAEVVDIARIPMDDKPVFDLLKRCATTAVFQLESRGMKDLVRRLQPDTFDDVIALVALFRPGPLQSGMVDDFINRKHGREQVFYPHPQLEIILKPTYGVILYQEQVMQIAQILGGYSLGGADLLRRAMGKKKPEEMAKHRSVFVDGAVAQNVESKNATAIFDLMEKFALYGFNKSHSAAYALLAYQTAWLKVHYPAEFMAAVLSADMDNTDKIVNLIEECRDMRLLLLPPNINESQYQFTVGAEANVVVYGLGAIKGVGESAIEHLLAERAARGPCKDLGDFCRRIDGRKINRRVIEALIRAGAMDCLDTNRAALMAQLSPAIKSAEQQHSNAATGIQDLFADALIQAPSQHAAVRIAEWDEATRLTGEKETLGLYLTGHPIERYRSELSCFVTGTLASLIGAESLGDEAPPSVPTTRPEQSVVVAGLVMAIRVFNTKRGTMAALTLDDRTARIEATLFSDLFDASKALVAKDRILVVQGKLGADAYSGGLRLTAESVHTLEDARSHFGQRLVIQIDGDPQSHDLAQHLAQVLTPFRVGKCPVWVRYRNAKAQAQIDLGDTWRVTPSDELLSQLKTLTGEKSVWVEYKTAAT